MLTIRASQDTYLKREIKPALELPSAYKKFSPQGAAWHVDQYTLEADDPIKIELAYGSGTWYLHRLHWDGFPHTSTKTPANTMPKISATQDTFLKREMKPSDQLTDAYKKLCKKGTEWQVDSYTVEADDYIKIELAYGAGTWYAYTYHWAGFPESKAALLSTPAPATAAAPKASGGGGGGGNVDGVPLPGIELIKKFEGIELSAYPDPLTGGDPWTIGYGSTFYTNGSKVKKGDKITKEQAEAELINNCKKSFLPALQKIPSFNEMDNYQKGALLSFAYNLGAGFYGARNFETITRVLKNKEWGSMRKALTLYVNPGSNVTEGLRRRRNAEADVWFTNVKEG